MLFFVALSLPLITVLDGRHFLLDILLYMYFIFFSIAAQCSIMIIKRGVRSVQWCLVVFFFSFSPFSRNASAVGSLFFIFFVFWSFQRPSLYRCQYTSIRVLHKLCSFKTKWIDTERITADRLLETRVCFLARWTPFFFFLFFSILNTSYIFVVVCVWWC